ncbi:MAG: HAD-IIIA family hydrolase [Lachnospiraceae bacterium]|nr:HAD-IIIA family hydrolase [Lachnospiraceae bacterium]
MFLDRFYPDHEVDSAYTIDYAALFASGKRAVIFDIDNTLVPHGAPADDRAIALFTKLHEIGYGTLLLSNNKEPRVKPFCDNVSSKYIHKAGKPGRAAYEKAMQLLESEPASTIFVGDQLFTDVWGAKKAGIETYLVKPIHPKEEIQIVLKRILEKVVLFFYHRKKK